MIKIGDFGLVTDHTDEEMEEFSDDSNPFRKHTSQVGTTLYMSPEQVRTSDSCLSCNKCMVGSIYHIIQGTCTNH